MRGSTARASTSTRGWCGRPRAGHDVELADALTGLQRASRARWGVFAAHFVEHLQPDDVARSSPRRPGCSRRAARSSPRRRTRVPVGAGYDFWRDPTHVRFYDPGCSRSSARRPAWRSSRPAPTRSTTPARRRATARGSRSRLSAAELCAAVQGRGASQRSTLIAARAPGCTGIRRTRSEGRTPTPGLAVDTPSGTSSVLEERLHTTQQELADLHRSKAAARAAVPLQRGLRRVARRRPEGRNQAVIRAPRHRSSYVN